MSEARGHRHIRLARESIFEARGQRYTSLEIKVYI